MIYVHSLGRALRFYAAQTALTRDGLLLTFRELHPRVEGIAATLTSHGFGVGDRLAFLLPNGPDHVAGLRRVFARRELSFLRVPSTFSRWASTTPTTRRWCSTKRASCEQATVHSSLHCEHLLDRDQDLAWTP